jgi:hypothetical protein
VVVVVGEDGELLGVYILLHQSQIVNCFYVWCSSELSTTTIYFPLRK